MGLEGGELRLTRLLEGRGGEDGKEAGEGGTRDGTSSVVVTKSRFDVMNRIQVISRLNGDSVAMVLDVRWD